LDLRQPETVTAESPRQRKRAMMGNTMVEH
jgi:hypothetical protein